MPSDRWAGLGLVAVSLAPHDPESVRESYTAILVSFASSAFLVR